MGVCATRTSKNAKRAQIAKSTNFLPTHTIRKQVEEFGKHRPAHTLLNGKIARGFVVRVGGA